MNIVNNQAKDDNEEAKGMVSMVDQKQELVWL